LPKGRFGLCNNLTVHFVGVPLVHVVISSAIDRLNMHDRLLIWQARKVVFDLVESTVVW